MISSRHGCLPASRKRFHVRPIALIFVPEGRGKALASIQALVCLSFSTRHRSRFTAVSPPHVSTPPIPRFRFPFLSQSLHTVLPSQSRSSSSRLHSERSRSLPFVSRIQPTLTASLLIYTYIFCLSNDFSMCLHASF